MDPTDPTPELDEVVKFLASAYHGAIFDHPNLTAVGLVICAFYPKAPFQIIKFPLWTVPMFFFVEIIRCLGFGEAGIKRDSLASRYQSERYRGHIASDSLFSHYQSVGARGPNSKIEAGGGLGIMGCALFLAAFLTWAGYMPDFL